MIPKPPKKKKEFNFNDPDFHQQKNEFNKQIRDIIFKFYKIIPRSKNRDLLLKFADCINPTDPVDVTRLPYVGKGSNAKQAVKLECVFALISWIIQCYWKFYINPVTIEGAEYEGGILHFLAILQKIHKNGLDQYQIKGDLANGFYLEKK